jgi:cholesterol oxidase
VVVLAAGTVGSSRLLLRSRRSLPRLAPALGSRFSGNGDALGLAFDPAADGVRGARNDYGPVMTSRLDYRADRGLMLADGGLPQISTRCSTRPAA